MKFCKDCVHFKRKRGQNLCLASKDQDVVYNVVTGKAAKVYIWTCLAMRNWDHKCSEDAVLFEPRPPSLTTRFLSYFKRNK